jgi:hypothetical protein
MRQSWTAFGLGFSLLCGCEVDVRDRPPPRHREVVYEPAPPPPAPVVVTEPAPAPLVEVIPDAPGPDYFWVGGRYYREHDHWVWHRGYYDRRHRP